MPSACDEFGARTTCSCYPPRRTTVPDSRNYLFAEPSRLGLAAPPRLGLAPQRCLLQCRGLAAQRCLLQCRSSSSSSYDKTSEHFWALASVETLGTANKQTNKQNHFCLQAKAVCLQAKQLLPAGKTVCLQAKPPCACRQKLLACTQKPILRTKRLSPAGKTFFLHAGKSCLPADKTTFACRQLLPAGKSCLPAGKTTFACRRKVFRELKKGAAPPGPPQPSFQNAEARACTGRGHIPEPAFSMIFRKPPADRPMHADMMAKT